MKKLLAFVFGLLTVVWMMSSCGRQVPPSESPAIIYSDTVTSRSLPIYEVLIFRYGSREDTDGIGSELTPEEIIWQYKEEIPMTEIADGQISLHPGAVKNDPSIAYSMELVGIYTAEGAKTEYTQEQLSELPDGKYVICAKLKREARKEIEESYFFAGIVKQVDENDAVTSIDAQYYISWANISGSKVIYE